MSTSHNQRDSDRESALPPKQVKVARTRRLESSMLMAIAAGTVGCAALAVSIYEAHLMREQQQVAVLPILEAWSSFEPGSRFALNIANKGIGPAILKSVTVSVNGTPMQSWNQVLREALGTDGISYGMSAITGNVLAAGETVTVVSISSGNDVRAVWEASESVSLEVCFCSVFDQCWVHTLDNLQGGVPRNEGLGKCDGGQESNF